MKKTNLFLIIAFITFIAIEAKGLSHYDPGDEHIYFYMGKLVSEGKLPYRDFFFAHPPLQVFANGLLFFVFGFNLIVLKLVPLIATLVSAFFLFKLAKEQFGDIAALFTLILFLFTYSIMLESTYALGIDLATMFVVLGIYFLNRNVLFSGVLFGLAGLTGLYSLAPIVVIFIYYLIKDRRGFLKLFSGFCLSFVSVNMIFIILFGKKFIMSVYLYHLLKPKVEGNNLSVFLEVVKNNLLVFLSAALLLFVKEKKKLELLAYVAVFYILFLLLLNKIFNFYFVLLFPVMAILGGYSLDHFYVRFKKWLVILFVVLLAVSLFFSVRHLFSFDFLGFESLDELKSFIENHSDKDNKIFGDDSVAPLLALATEREIAFDFVDTNDMRFLSGLSDVNSVIDLLRKGDVKFVIVRPLYGIGRLPEFWEFVNKECKLVFGIKDKYWSDIVIYDCEK